jgi:hypothetical protein
MTPEDMARAVLNALDHGLFQTLYRMTWVDPGTVVKDVRASGADVTDLSEFGNLPTDQLDSVADRYIRRARRSAAISGISFGAGGWLGLPPGLGHLVVVIVRMAQRISLTYGFDYRTDRGEIELWKGLAAATGANIDWEGTEADLMRRLPAVVTGTGAFSNPLMLKAFQAVVTRIAIASGLRLTRWVPVVGGGSGLVLNWLQVDSIGRHLKETWRRQHILVGFDPSGAVEVEVLSSPT